MSSLNLSISSYAAQSIHSLQQVKEAMNDSLTKIRTGYRINSAKDDPGGMIDAVYTSRDINASEAAIKNNQDSYNKLAKVETTQTSMLNTLQEIRKYIKEANESSDDYTRAAAIGAITTLLDSFDQLARGTTINNKAVMGGAGKITFDSTATQLLDTDATSIRKMSKQSPVMINFQQANAAEQAYVDNAYVSPGVGNDSTIRITTDSGATSLTIAAGTNITDATAAINSAIDSIGGFAQENGGNIVVGTSQYGTERSIKIETISGDNIFGAATVEDTAGLDGSININGSNYVLTDDLEVNVSSGTVSGKFVFDGSKVGVDPTTGAAPASNAVSLNPSGGLYLHTGSGSSVYDSAYYGFDDLRTEKLGIDRIISNGDPLYFLDHMDDAIAAIDDAIAKTLESNVNISMAMNYDLLKTNDHLGEMIESMYDHLDEVISTDQAYETARLAQVQLLQQAGLNSLTVQMSANEKVLSLLSTSN
jgi:flagellin